MRLAGRDASPQYGVASVGRASARSWLSATTPCAGVRAPEAAAKWLEDGTPLVAQAGVPAFELAGSYLYWTGHPTVMVDWTARAVEGHWMPESVGPWIANNYAWYCYLKGRSATGLAYAREAVAAMPEQWGFLGTLGRILIEVGQPEEAVEVLRRSIAIDSQPRTRVALARALAACGDYEEAVRQANQGLTEQAEPWPSGESARSQVQTWVDEWQAARST